MFGRCNSTLALCPSHPEKSFSSNLVRTIGSWTAGSSTHLSSTCVMIHPPPNEEAVRMCRLKGTPNDRHQLGGRCERRRRSLVVGELWNKHVVRFEGSAKVGGRSSLVPLRRRSGRMGWVTEYAGISVQPAEYGQLCHVRTRWAKILALELTR